MTTHDSGEIVSDDVLTEVGGLSIERGLITPQMAVLASKQAILLNGLAKRCLIPFTYRQNVADNPARSVLAVNVPGLAGRGFVAQFASLLSVYDRAGEVLSPSSDTLYLDFYDGGGQAKPYTGRINPEAEETLSIGLLGQAGLQFATPVPMEEQPTFELGPTDGLHLDHTVQEKPLHSTWNSSVSTRIELLVERS